MPCTVFSYNGITHGGITNHAASDDQGDFNKYLISLGFPQGKNTEFTLQLGQSEVCEVVYGPDENYPSSDNCYLPPQQWVTRLKVPMQSGRKPGAVGVGRHAQNPGDTIPIFSKSVHVPGFQSPWLTPPGLRLRFKPGYPLLSTVYRYKRVTRLKVPM